MITSASSIAFVIGNNLSKCGHSFSDFSKQSVQPMQNVAGGTFMALSMDNNYFHYVVLLNYSCPCSNFVPLHFCPMLKKRYLFSSSLRTHQNTSIPFFSYRYDTVYLQNYHIYGKYRKQKPPHVLMPTPYHINKLFYFLEHHDRQSSLAP